MSVTLLTIALLGVALGRLLAVTLLTVWLRRLSVALLTGGLLAVTLCRLTVALAVTGILRLLATGLLAIAGVVRRLS